MCRTSWWLGLTAVGLMFGISAPIAADAVLDGTTGSTGSFAGDFEVPAEVGRREGPNLFHSFERFHIRQDESATFTGPSGIDNVVSRVTGDEASRISGLLRSTVPGADFWFLNPRGIVFGRGARLDVDGSFHAATADELRFSDGGAFSATAPTTGSSFSAAVPEAFGFLGAGQGNLVLDRGRLSVPAGEALSLVGGDITITAGDDGTFSGGRAGMVQAEAGRVTLAALGGPGVANVASGEIAGTAFGDIHLTDQAFVGASGGMVAIRGGQVAIRDLSFVSAGNEGDDAGGGISITAAGVELDRGFVGALASGAGDAGPIAITSGRVQLRNESFITSGSGQGSTGAGGDITLAVGSLDVAGGSAIGTDTFGTGGSRRSGDLTVTASERVFVAGTGMLLDGSPVFSTLSTGVIGENSGDGGRLTVKAPRLEVGAGGIISGTTSGSGRGGNVDLAVGHLTVSAGGSVRTSTAFGTGAAGDLTVTAADGVSVTGSGPGAGGLLSPSTLETSTFDTKAPAGRITITAPRVEVSEEAVVSALTGGPGAGGAIDLKVGRLIVTGNGAVTASSQGVGDTGPAGSVTVNAGEVITLANGGTITAFATGSGPGGPVKIAAPRLDITTGGSVTTSTIFGTGDGGAIDIAVDRLVITDGGFLQAATLGRGEAGDLTVTAAESITVAGTGSRLQASTAPELTDPVRGPRSSGPGGTIRVNAPVIRVVDGGAISARSQGTGRAGDVVVTAPDRLELHDAAITTAAAAAGGGRITLTVGDLIELRRSEVTTSVVESGSMGNGGDIVALDPRFLVLDGSRISANAVRGTGGNIRIEVGDVFRTPESLIEASSQLGIDGTVEVIAPDLDLTSELAALPTAYIDVVGLLRESCAVRPPDRTSSFVIAGGRSLAADPALPLAGRYADEHGTRAAALHHWTPSEGHACSGEVTVLHELRQ